MSVIEAKNIKKVFQEPKTLEVLRGVDLAIEKGESVAIMGRSGEGKSTLLNILGTLDNQTSGEVYINGIEVGSFNKAALRSSTIGFVFQSFHLLDDFTVLENVMMPAMIARSANAQAKERCISLLERVGLSDRIHNPSKLLSGGEKQRVAIARALCNDPEIIFADEPTGNLDRKTAEGIQQLLFDFCAEGKTLVIVTHDEELAAKCSRKLILQDGTIPND